jgi:hypothetical protein
LKELSITGHPVTALVRASVLFGLPEQCHSDVNTDDPPWWLQRKSSHLTVDTDTTAQINNCPMRFELDLLQRISAAGEKIPGFFGN